MCVLGRERVRLAPVDSAVRMFERRLDGEQPQVFLSGVDEVVL
jgi:hypothetical protein